MPIDADKFPLLFSTTTRLAYDIDNFYYNRKHFVWVALYVDNLNIQAASSNPLTIAADFAKGIVTLDRHNEKILGNIVGVRNGVKYMYEAGKITALLKKEIISYIQSATFKDFFPMIYIIDTKKVNSRIVPVPSIDGARASSPEYKIFDLQDGEFELLDLSEVISAGKIIPRERVGENAGKKK